MSLPGFTAVASAGRTRRHYMARARPCNARDAATVRAAGWGTAVACAACAVALADDATVIGVIDDPLGAYACYICLSGSVDV